MSLRNRAWSALVFVHRWLGIAGCLLFLLWFMSGIAMIYVRMPDLADPERLAQSDEIRPEEILVPPEDAAAAAQQPSSSPIEIAMLGSRPVFRFGERSRVTVYADRLERLQTVSADYATELARRFARTTVPMNYLGVLQQPDQWTLQLTAHLPLHHFSLGHPEDAELYLSSRTGDVVMRTTSRERRFAYLGPVAHWLYLPVLRRNGALWTRVIVWSSALGCLLCASGLVVGALRFSPSRRFTVRAQARRSPYVGWMKWHHCAGLIFGVVTLSWTFSGMLSMDPFAVLSTEGATEIQRRSVSGPTDRDGLPGLRATRQAVESARRRMAPKSLRLIRFQGESYWRVTGDAKTNLLISVRHPDAAALPRFDSRLLESAARAAAPDGASSELTWLSDYDEYYYDRDRRLPLPVLRARYSDARHTWLYLDPASGAIARVLRRPDRINRWLYHGLHSLDPGWLRNRRPMWDVVVIALSLGGIAGVAASLLPAWRRVRRRVHG